MGLARRSQKIENYICVGYGGFATLRTKIKYQVKTDIPFVQKKQISKPLVVCRFFGAKERPFFLFSRCGCSRCELMQLARYVFIAGSALAQQATCAYAVACVTRNAHRSGHVCARGLGLMGDIWS
jgi:hypothetical protein